MLKREKIHQKEQWNHKHFSSKPKNYCSGKHNTRLVLIASVKQASVVTLKYYTAASNKALKGLDFKPHRKRFTVGVHIFSKLLFILLIFIYGPFLFSFKQTILQIVEYECLLNGKIFQISLFSAL